LSDLQPRQLWEAALGDLQVQVARPSYDTFLLNTVGVSLEDDCLVIGANSSFAAEYLEKRLRSVVQTAVERVAHSPLDVRFQVSQSSSVVTATEIADEQAQPQVQTSNVETPTRHRFAGETPALPLDPRYVFSQFTVGCSNELAMAAATAAAERPGQKYNPVFLYSPSGLGKTHLLHAIGHRIRERGLTALYVSSDQFITEFVRSIREGRASEFREKYRSPDVLLMDDIQFLSGKEQTQEGLFHIFNELHHSGRQVVIASDRSPSALHPLNDRLRSRFEWGLIADIQPPDLETRLAILRAKADALDTSVPLDVLEFLGQRNCRSIRELEGQLNRVAAYADLTGKPVTMALGEQALGGLQGALEAAPRTTESVLESVASYYRTTPAAMKGPNRERSIARARHTAMYLMREDMGLSLVEIGRSFGGRDHSTVFQACSKMAGLVENDTTLQRDLVALREKIDRA
jgi:chromosomal replication initiator protein